MSDVKIKGIVLKEVNMGDYDKMLTILTPHLGKISCVAKGARRQNSKILAAQLLYFGEFNLFKSKKHYYINSCDGIESFYDIRIDLEKFTYASHVIKIILDTTDENQNTFNILQLLLNTLYMIDVSEKDTRLILAVFKIRLLCLNGLVPIVDRCATCGDIDNNIGFSIRDNGFKCGKCEKLDKSTIQMNVETKIAIEYIVKAAAKKIFSFETSEESIKELELISNIYLNTKLEKEYKVDKDF